MAQWLKRVWTSTPIVVRPLLVFAIFPILAHQLFIGTPSTTKAAKQLDVPSTEELTNLIASSQNFRRTKGARCWTGSNLEITVDTNPTVPVCRALVALGYLDPVTKRTTAKGRSQLGYSYSHDKDIYLNIARSEFRTITSVTPPPQETSHMKNAVRVEFTWVWREINPVGRQLRISSHRGGMRGVAHLMAIEGTWRVVDLRLEDGSPKYH